MATREYGCKQCGQSFGSEDELTQHNQRMHMSAGATNTTETGGGVGAGGGSMGGGMGRGGMGGMDAGEGTQGDVGKEKR